MEFFSTFYNENEKLITPAQREKFWGLAEQLPEVDFFRLARRNGGFEAITNFIINGNITPSLTIYKYWAGELANLNFNDDGANRELLTDGRKLTAVFSKIIKESPDLIPKLAESGFEVFLAAQTMQKLEISPDDMPFLTRSQTPFSCRVHGSTRRHG